MKPRTYEEKRIAQYCAEMPELTSVQKFYAEKNLNKKIAYIAKRKAWCNQCGGELQERNKKGFDKKEIVCPHCDSTLKVELLERHQTFFINNYYYCVVTTCKGYQVIRNFLFRRIEVKSKKIRFAIHEVVQNWINEDGKEFVMAKSCSSSLYYRDSWKLSDDLSLKKKNGYYGYKKYDLEPNLIYSRVRLIPIVKRNGIKNDFYGITPSSLCKAVICSNDAEYLVKTKQIELLRIMISRGYSSCPYKDSVNICNRHKYIIEDGVLWLDMVQSLNVLEKDLRNAKYVCPENLKEAHDQFVAMRRKKEQKVREQEKKKRIREWAVKYKNLKKNFLNLVIDGENIRITVLQDIEEFKEEGKAMNHCVFANAYYENEHSLIMSAKDKEGKRIETIELNLRTMQVIQSRGVNNSITERHDEILKLIEKNLPRIKKRLNAA